MEFSEVLQARYSVRKFDSRPVEPEKVKALLEACRIAPSAVNYQPWRILVLDQPEALAKLKACTRYDFDAPLALLVCYDWEQVWKRGYDGHHSGDVDTGILGTYLMLKAFELGLGNTWVMSFDPAEMRKQYDIPAHLVPAALFPLGYPAAEAKPSPMHEQRKALEDIVFYNGFAPEA